MRGIVAFAALVALCAPARADLAVEGLPDLVPDMGGIWVDYTWIDYGPQGYVFGPAVLSFDLISQNFGQFSMDLLADDPADLPGSVVSQCTAWTAEFLCGQRSPVAGVTWNEADKRYRFSGYAFYELRRINDDGTADFTADGLLATRAKPAGCLRDDLKVHDEARPVPRYAVYGVCNPVESGITPGWSTVFAAQTYEQDVPLDGIDDGRYALVITLNPEGYLLEESRANNRLLVIIDIEGKNQPFPVVTTVSKTLI